jgi:hypothetical protein
MTGVPLPVSEPQLYQGASACERLWPPGICLVWLIVAADASASQGLGEV